MKYNISTVTLSGKYINCELNLYNVGKYLNIDENIIGIKYCFCNDSILKGVYQTCDIKKTKKKAKQVNKTLFYNQISMILKYQNNQVNLKLFKNGSVQITGCKNIAHINSYLTILYKKLINLQDKRHKILLTKQNNLLLDCNNYIYNYIEDSKDYQIIGFYDNKTSKINNFKLNDQFIQIKKETINPLYTIINYNTSPFIKYNEQYNKDNDINNLYEINIDCINICININTTLNLYKLYEYLIYNQYICKYNPESYSGIKFMYKLPYNYCENVKLSGICNCNSKCICTNITFLIFQTGKIICSGFKSFQQIDLILPHLTSIIDKYKIIKTLI